MVSGLKIGKSRAPWFGCRGAAMLLCAAALFAAPAARAGTVALTFDDLPVFGAFVSAADGAALTDRLLAGFARHRWTVTGFVNEIQLDAPDRQQRIALLAHWLDAGMVLGNHGYAHLSLNATPVDAYIADVAHGGIATGALLAARGQRETWFRYPFLETGLDLATRRRFETWLSDHGYRVAPVTMENSDWRFSAAFDAAVARGDRRAAARIRRSYLLFTAASVGWYRRAGRTLFGREPAFVFLLHASHLNAVSIDGLALILKRAGLRVVPLATALRDPAYRSPDDYVGRGGIEWLERWSLARHRSLPFERFPRLPRAIAQRSVEPPTLPAPPAIPATTLAPR